MSYTVKFTKSAEKDLALIPKIYYNNIVEHIFLLQKEPRPHGVIKLKGYTHTYRIRVGVYRVLYEISDKEISILIIAIVHRKESYE